MSDRKRRVCPVEMAGSLDNRIRRWVQDPRKILGPYLKEGMTALDLGCGPGFFTLDMALLVGGTGRVIASDLQEGMLQKVREKIEGTELEERIILHKCNEKRIGLSEEVDFILLFYMVHEVPDKKEFFSGIAGILKKNGKVLMAEPPFHVSKKAFDETLKIAGEAGLSHREGPKVFFSKSAILEKG
jgi:ubiquinone/menaquinone biosynthesis C-methylase UbiE